MSWSNLKQRIWIPPEGRPPFRGEIGRSRFVIVLAILLITGDWLGKNIVFDPPSKWLGDILLRTREVQVPRYTRLVQIDAADREKVLLGKTPLDGRALFRAVCGLAASKPAVIVVDLDTSSEKSFPKEMKDLPDFHGVPVVWAVNANWEPVGRNLLLKSGRFLSGNFVARFGVARMPVGFDGVVREWYPSIEVNGAETPSLTAKAVQLYCQGRWDCPFGREPSLAVDYAFPPMHLSEFVPELSVPRRDGDGAVLALKAPIEKSKPFACSAGDSLGFNQKLDGMKVVLGAIHEYEDRHDTPWGTKSGAELVAMSIEESLNPHGIGRLPSTLKWGLKILLAIGVAALHHFFWPIAATVLTVLLLPFAVLVSSLAMFWFGDYQLATVPLVAGILLEQLATSAEKGEHWAHHAKHP